MFIQDLSKELDSKSLSAVRGGDNGNSVSNIIGQEMALSVPVAVGVAGPANTNVHVNGTQNSSIGTFQYGGDSYFAGLFPSSGTILKGL